MACPACGRENPDGFAFCGFCGAALAAAAPQREVRKTVTVVFCDVTGSTALGERLDPEALRRTMARYFEEIRAVVERHGGTVEKFVGDAAMAVFGIPVAHEDDALRAVRAAAEIRERLAALADELAVALVFRTGVNTGPVVAGEGETLVTGDAVNVAARLEQAAQPGEILVGAETLRLVRDAVVVEAVAPLELKGKREPVAAYRLRSVDPAAAGRTRRLDAPLVGRERELARLRRDFADAVADRTCHLFTLLGPAGVGKSRLVAGFLEDADGADVLRGRCLHYGSDITYWPLVEILLGIGVEVDEVIGASPAETQLAFRRLLESRALERPQIVLLDDLQWAEPTFLDLVEHVADWSRDAPIFLLCVARPELLEERAAWGGGKLNATTILLEPLSAAESEALASRLAGGRQVDSALRRIVTAAGGNPLFLEELLAMAEEEGGGEALVIPPTIQALLQARLERLGSGERDVIERGAVEGEIFHSGAVVELAPQAAQPEVPAHLLALVRKELIRPHRPVFVGDDAFRFRHLLIRDAAYEALPKLTRADLHERFAGWLDRHAALVEQDEIVGYHLEQAHRSRSELDPADGGLPELGRRAATHLLAAASGAFGRGDYDAATGLIARGAELLPAGDPQRLAMLAELLLAFSQGVALDLAPAVADELTAAADSRTRAYGEIVRGWLRYYEVGGAPIEPGWLSEVRGAFAKAGDEVGLAYCEWLLFGSAWAACRAEEAAAAARRGIEHARRAGADRVAAQLLGIASLAPVFGPMHVEEGLRFTRDARSGASGGVLERAQIERLEGRLLAMRGEFDRARELMHAGQAAFRDAGLLIEAAAHSQSLMFLEARAGDLVAAEREGRAGATESERLGDRAYHGTTLLVLADVVARAGRYEEAEALCAEARAMSPPDDVATICGVDALEGHLLARRGDVVRGERLARRGLELAETTDFVEVRGLAHMRAAQALAAAGKSDEALALAQNAVAIYTAKGDVTGAAVARAVADELAGAVPGRPFGS
jgi:class 3 adenylate cyclase